MGHSGPVRGRRTLLAALALAAAWAGSSCSWASGEEQQDRFEKWYAENPVRGVELDRADGQDVLPLVGGKLEVTARLTTTEPDAADVERAMRGLCGFEEVAADDAEVEYVLLVDTASLLFPCARQGPREMARLWEALPRGRDVESVAVRPAGAQLQVGRTGDVVARTRELVGALTRTSWGPRLPISVTSTDAAVGLAGSAGAGVVLDALEAALKRSEGVRRLPARADEQRLLVLTDLTPREADRLREQVDAAVAGRDGAPAVVVLPDRVDVAPGTDPGSFPAARRALVDRLAADPRTRALRLGEDDLDLGVGGTSDGRALLGELATDPGTRGLDRVEVRAEGTSTGSRCRTTWRPDDALTRSVLVLGLCDVDGVSVAEDDPRGRGIEVDLEERALGDVTALLADAPPGTRVVLQRQPGEGTSAGGRPRIGLGVEADGPVLDDTEEGPGDEAERVAWARAVERAWP